jgi:hypothetical protein
MQYIYRFVKNDCEIGEIKFTHIPSTASNQKDINGI